MLQIARIKQFTAPRIGRQGREFHVGQPFQADNLQSSVRPESLTHPHSRKVFRATSRSEPKSHSPETEEDDHPSKYDKRLADIVARMIDTNLQICTGRE